MKVLVLVALFAFVAVQVCQAAPLPEESADKVEKKEESPAPAPPAEHTEHPAETVAEAKPETEAKSEAPKTDNPEATPAAELKKDA